jgi:hypothetical protein
MESGIELAGLEVAELSDEELDVVGGTGGKVLVDRVYRK